MLFELVKWCKRRVDSFQLFRHLVDFLVLIEVVSHKFEQRLLLDVVLNFPLKYFNVFLLRLYSVLMDLALKLHTWEDLFSIYLKVLQLLNNTSVLLLLGQTHQFIIQTNIFKSCYEL